MKAIIPAAGVGTRLRPHTLTIPKVLLNVAGKPIIGHIIESLIKADIDEITLIVGYQAEKVQSYLQEHFNQKFSFVYQETREGLGHAVGLGLDNSDTSAIIILGDTIFDVDFTRFTNSAENIIGVVEVKDPRRFGIVETDGLKVTGLIEKPDITNSNLAIAGIYTVRSQKLLKQAVDYLIKNNIRTRNEYQLTDALQRMLEAGETIRTEKIKGWFDCGTLDSLLETNRFLLKKDGNDFQGENNVILPPVFIESSCEIKNSIIGPFVTIDAGTTVTNSIIKDSIIGKNSLIENGIIEHTLIGDHSQVKERPHSYNIGNYTRIDFY